MPDAFIPISDEGDNLDLTDAFLNLEDVPGNKSLFAETSSKCIVYLHPFEETLTMHNTRTFGYEISPYVKAASTTVGHEGGDFSLQLVPRVEWYNYIQPGDYVNIYLSLDGTVDDDHPYNKGNVRVFFGRVKTIERTMNIDKQGNRSISYSVNGSHFASNFQETVLYQDAFLRLNKQVGKTADNTEGLRSDLAALFNMEILLAKGLVSLYSCHDIIYQLILSLSGYGEQFILPRNYKDVLIGATFKPKNINAMDASFTELYALLKSASGTQTGSTERVRVETTFEKEFEKVIDLNSITPVISDRGVEFQDGSDVLFGVYTNTIREKALQSMFKVYLSTKMHQSGMQVTQSNVWDRTTSTHHRPVTSEEVGFYHSNKHKTEVASYGMALTLANRLSFDYVEEIDGVMFPNTIHSLDGTLYNLLMETTNKSMNQVYLDLRPFQGYLYKTTKKYYKDTPLLKDGRDGLGVELDGAIPIVPAVIAHPYPFTVYQPKYSEEAFKYYKNIKSKGASKNSPISVRSTKTGYLEVSLEIPDASKSFVTTTSGTLTDTSKAILDKAKETNKQLKEFKGPYYYDTYVEKIKKGELSADDTHKALVYGVHQRLGYFTLPRSVIPIDTNKIPYVYRDTYYSYTEGSVGLYLLNVADTVAMAQVLDKFSDEISKKSAEIESINKTISDLESQISEINKSKMSLPSTKEVRPYPKKAVAISIAEQLKPLNNSLKIWKEELNKKHEELEAILARRKAWLDQGKPSEDSSGNTASASVDPASSTTGPQTADNSAWYPLYSKDQEYSLEKKEGYKLDTDKVTEVKVHAVRTLPAMSLLDRDILSERIVRDTSSVKNFFTAAPLVGNMPDIPMFKQMLAPYMPFMSTVSIQRDGLRIFSEEMKYLMPSLMIDYGISASSRQLLKWLFTTDNWNSSGRQLLKGQFTLRGFPGVRPGYWLYKIPDKLAMYVETVQHSWNFPGKITTTVQVSRVQKFSPVLTYIPPQPQVDPWRQTRRCSDDPMMNPYPTVDSWMINNVVKEPKEFEPGMFIGYNDVLGVPLVKGGSSIIEDDRYLSMGVPGVDQIFKPSTYYEFEEQVVEPINEPPNPDEPLKPNE